MLTWWVVLNWYSILSPLQHQLDLRLFLHIYRRIAWWYELMCDHVSSTRMWAIGFTFLMTDFKAPTRPPLSPISRCCGRWTFSDFRRLGTERYFEFQLDSFDIEQNKREEICIKNWFLMVNRARERVLSNFLIINLKKKWMEQVFHVRRPPREISGSNFLELFVVGFLGLLATRVKDENQLCLLIGEHQPSSSSQ